MMGKWLSEIRKKFQKERKCRTRIGSFKNINSTNSFGGKDKVL